MKRIDIVETNLIFARPLSPRLKTDQFTLHWIGKIGANLPPDSIDVDMVNEWHIYERGWAGIGYHYLVKRDATVERGRPRQCIGAHDEGDNLHTIGICIVSGPGLPPTEAQIDAVCRLLAELCDIYGLLPQDPDTINGHRDDEPPETPTECPGDIIYGMLPAIRERVRGLCGY